jgi:hypothetical protein
LIKATGHCYFKNVLIKKFNKGEAEMKTKFSILLFTLTALFFITPNIYTQDKPASHIYEMNFLTFSYDQMEEYMQLYETIGKPLDEQNEYIISTKILRHFSGPSWNLCFVTEYKDLDAFSAAQKRGDELFEKMFTDKTKRDEISKKYLSFLRGHTDALVRDSPKLEKMK